MRPGVSSPHQISRAQVKNAPVHHHHHDEPEIRSEVQVDGDNDLGNRNSLVGSSSCFDEASACDCSFHPLPSACKPAMIIK
nr:hypothetical protein CFP56_54375 [Quercus suber]